MLKYSFLEEASNLLYMCNELKENREIVLEILPIHEYF